MAVGRDGTGAWRTAALKEYPPRMCRPIAGAFRDSLGRAVERRREDALGADAVAELERLVVPLEEGTVGPDFAAQAAAGLPSPVPWDRLAAAAGTAPVRLREATLEEPVRRWKRRGSTDRPD